MITSNRNLRPQALKKASIEGRVRGFTLVEIMVTVTLFSLVIASLISTFLVFNKGMAGLGNYTSMSVSSRGALEYFSRDIHVAQSLVTANGNEVVLVLPDDAGGFTISYKYDPVKGEFTRKKYDTDGTTLLSTDILFKDVEIFKMVFYNRLNVDVTSEASVLTEAKTVQINAKLVKKVIDQNNTDYIISARFLMRNRSSVYVLWMYVM